MTAPIKPSVRPELAIVELDGEAVIYDEDGARLHHLNSTATIVLSMCDGTSTIRQMSQELAQAFDVPSSEVEPQVRSVVRSFRRAGLLGGRRP